MINYSSLYELALYKHIVYVNDLIELAFLKAYLDIGCKRKLIFEDKTGGKIVSISVKKK